MIDIEFYKTFTSEDFLLDDNFRRLVAGQTVAGKSMDWLESMLPDKKEEIRLASEILRGMRPYRYGASEEKIQEVWDKAVRGHRVRLWAVISRYAAVFLLLLGVGSIFFYLNSKETSIQEFARTEKISSDDAVLVLAGNEQVAIKSDESKIHYSADGSGVLLNDTASVEQSIEQGGFNQLIVPYGKRSNMVLSDGTKVWLNAGSRLIYPPVFKGRNREVYLEGEGYFEVSPDAQKAFYVKTEAFAVKVYGTRFNIQAYKEDNEYNTVLVEGKVSMEVNGRIFSKEFFLSPEQKGTYINGQDNFQISPVTNVGDYIAWTNGYLTFKDEDVSSVLRRLSRYYNVDIECKEGSRLIEVSGKLDLKDNLERLLNGLCTMSHTRYFKEGDKYIFYSN